MLIDSRSCCIHCGILEEPNCFRDVILICNLGAKIMIRKRQIIDQRTVYIGKSYKRIKKTVKRNMEKGRFPKQS